MPSEGSSENPLESGALQNEVSACTCTCTCRLACMHASPMEKRMLIFEILATCKYVYHSRTLPGVGSMYRCQL